MFSDLLVCMYSFLKLRNVDDDDDDDGYDGGNNDDDGDDGERKLVEELINGTNNNCALFRHAALDSLNYNSFPFGFFFSSLLCCCLDLQLVADWP